MKLKTKFQDEDFGLGEVVDASIMYGYGDKIEVSCTGKMKHRKYNSIKDFTDHWEDAPEEPKEYWYINEYGTVTVSERYGRYTIYDESKKNFGNYFETKEEAEKAVEKLKAFKRLEDKGFDFINFGYKKLCKYDVKNGVGNLQYQVPYYDELEEDLDICFGGEE